MNEADLMNASEKVYKLHEEARKKMGRIQVGHKMGTNAGTVR